MKNKIWLTPIIVMALLLTLTNSCKKETNGPPPTTFTIGQSYQGGKIAYIDGTGLHGLIAAPSDQSSGAAWGCMNLQIGGAWGDGLNAGSYNTNDILAACNEQGIAAKICNDLILGGYDDWYLPSKNQMDVLYQDRTIIGGFNNIGDYWTSTQVGSASASDIRFGFSGVSLPTDKDVLCSVRAVRSF